MRSIIPAAMILILVATVSAAGGQVVPEFWTVVQDEAPAVAVVNAANFAASMRGSAATTFSGKTWTQAADELITTDLEESVLVIFEGTSVTIMGDDDLHGLLMENAEVYLEDQGYSVKVIGPDWKFFIPEVEDEVLVSDKEIDDLEAEVDEIDSVVDDLQGIVVLADHDEPEQIDPPSMELDSGPSEEEEPGILTKIWRWFAGLFS